MSYQRLKCTKGHVFHAVVTYATQKHQCPWCADDARREAYRRRDEDTSYQVAASIAQAISTPTYTPSDSSSSSSSDSFSSGGGDYGGGGSSGSWE